MISSVFLLLAAHFAFVAAELVIPWESLNVTYGPPDNKNTLASMPRSVKDAITQGFVRLDSNSNCRNGKFLGFRYWMNEDPSVILLFDKNGIIAGIQSAVPKEKADSIKKVYSYASMPTYQKDTIIMVSKKMSADSYITSFKNVIMSFIGFEAAKTIVKQDVYVSTVYFIAPADVCGKGRTEKDLNSEGTLTDIYIQNGPDPLKNVMDKIPIMEDGLTSMPEWTKEKCYETMGMHYFYKLSLDMKCKDIFNFFLIYNKKQLTAFGFLHVGVYNTSRFEVIPYEFSEKIVYVPYCVKDFYKKENAGGFTTMHVFFNAKEENRNC